MDKEQVLEKIGAERLIAVVRVSESEKVVRKTIEALSAAGVSVIEITTTVPDAVALVGSLTDITDRDFLIGAGTVLDAQTAAAMIEAGAEFIVSPAIIEEVIATANLAGVPVFPGALTPTEVLRAHSLGASAVKVFPASLFGPFYLKALAGPLPGVPLIPTGGVNLGNITDYIRAGAFAVGVGGNLIDTYAIRAGDWASVSATAMAYVKVVKGSRAPGIIGRGGPVKP